MMPPNQKHRLLYASLFFLFTGLFVSYGYGPLTAQVFDGSGLQGGLGKAQEEISGTGIRPEGDLIPALASIINFALSFVAVFAVIAFIVAGFMFILGFGSDTANQRAKKIMIWAVVGLLVIMLSFVMVKFIVDLATA